MVVPLPHKGFDVESEDFLSEIGLDGFSRAAKADEWEDIFVVELAHVEREVADVVPISGVEDTTAAEVNTTPNHVSR